VLAIPRPRKRKGGREGRMEGGKGEENENSKKEQVSTSPSLPPSLPSIKRHHPARVVDLPGNILGREGGREGGREEGKDDERGV